jgi:cytidine deaminase
MANEELILRAANVLKPHATTGGRLIGDVGATLLTDKGNLYSGVCIDTGSGTGFCAEHSAIAAMVTSGEYRIARIVAVWKDERDGKLYVLPPCGRCREFIRQINEENLETEVVLGTDKTVKLKELLPYHRWPEPLDIGVGAVFGDEDERFGGPLSERKQVNRAGHRTRRRGGNEPTLPSASET